MKLKTNITVRQIGDEHILIANNANQLDYTQIISLNNSAAYLLKETAYAEISATGWANLLVDKYSIPYQQALADAEKLIEKLQEAGVLE